MWQETFETGCGPLHGPSRPVANPIQGLAESKTVLTSPGEPTQSLHRPTDAPRRRRSSVAGGMPSAKAEIRGNAMTYRELLRQIMHYGRFDRMPVVHRATWPDTGSMRA